MRSLTAVDQEPSFVLYQRPYRETSLLVEVLTQDHGRIGLIARGAKRPKSRMAALLQPFRPLTLSWTGRGDLKTLRSVEEAGAFSAPAGDLLMPAFYLNELLLKALRRGDPHPGLFAHYMQALSQMGSGALLGPSLRMFELSLLDECGYGLVLDRAMAGAEPIEPDGRYRYDLESGPHPIPAGDKGGLVFAGSHLMAMGRGDFSDPQVAVAARELFSAAIKHFFGLEALKTRTVYRAMRR